MEAKKEEKKRDEGKEVVVKEEEKKQNYNKNKNKREKKRRKKKSIGPREERVPSPSSHLAALEWVQPGEVGGTDDLRVGGVRGASAGGLHAVEGQALGVGESVVLPGLEATAVQRALKDPVARTRRHGALHDHVGHLVHLRGEEG